MKTILVTGGTGYIGSHTSLELLKKGYRVIIFDSLVNSSEKVINKINLLLNDKNLDNKFTFIKGDLSEAKLLEGVFEGSKEKGSPISSVIHFAGLKSVAESVSNPLKYWDKNVGGSINLFKIMEKFDCRTIIFSSSATVYQIKGNSFLRESSPIQASNPYGQTKVAIESLLNDIFLNSQNNWKIVNLRYFNPIGAHNSGFLGEDPVGMPNNIFPLILKVASKKMEKLNIFGNNWPTKDRS